MSGPSTWDRGCVSTRLEKWQMAVVVKTVLGSHFGVFGAPPVLVGILVGIEMFSGGMIWILKMVGFLLLSLANLVKKTKVCPTHMGNLASPSFCGTFGEFPPCSSQINQRQLAIFTEPH